MKSLREEFFDEPEFESVTLDKIPIESWDKSDDPEEWVFVRARSQTRGSMLYSDGIYRVVKTKTAKPLTQDTTEVMSEDEILDRMPKRLKENKVVPSPSGEYVTLTEVYSTEHSDGTLSIDTHATTTTIPVEFVKEVISYDEVMVEYIDEEL